MSNPLVYNSLKVFKKIYGTLINPNLDNFRNWNMFSNKAYANDLIYKYLMDEKPCMIGRFGANELSCLTNFIGVKGNKRDYLGYIKGHSLPWWWEKSVFSKMEINAGFFPANQGTIEKFCGLMFRDMEDVDLLGSWLMDEKYFQDKLTAAKRVVLEDLEPFFAPNPWTRALEGKRVLVVHPFAETIENQYVKRNLLFENGLLPDFELKTLKAVVSLAGEKTRFSDWFEALDYMKLQIDQVDFDICIIGAGAYGFPLAAHVKRNGKKAFHMGGVTQLLFGIKGARWEQFIVWPYVNLFNEYWVRPGNQERPSGAQKVEGATYW